MNALLRLPGAVFSMPATAANISALIVILLSIFTSMRQPKLGADLYIVIYSLILVSAKITNFWFGTERHLGFMATGLLSRDDRWASKHFALYIWHPALAYVFATTLHWLRMASVFWFAACLWQGFYIEAAALIALFISVSGPIAAMYPDLYFVDAVERGNEGAAKMLRSLRQVQQIWSREHRFEPHLRTSTKPASAHATNASGGKEGIRDQHRASQDKSSANSRLSPDVEAVFKKLDRLMNDEKAQIESLPEPFRSKVLSGADCDAVAGAAGEFGRDPRNPIPVNGPLGEMIYLSNLLTTQQIMFHRLGSVRNVDAYETVSLDGAVWDILFLHLYHPRKSRRAPAGYRIARGPERERLLLGANEFVADFPDGLPAAIANTTERLLGLRMRPRQVREAIERRSFKRPADHLERLKTIKAMLETNSTAKPLSDVVKIGGESRSKPFYLNATREERRDWFARTQPWNRVASTVVDAILDGITDKTLLEAFVVASMENGLVARYEPLGREGSDDPTVIRAQVSQILCQTGSRAIGSFEKALKAGQRDAAAKAGCLAQDTFEAAIALAKNQIAAYTGLAAMYRMVGKRAECHDYAKRGLVELAELAFHKSAVLPADVLDQIERLLRSYLEY